MTNLRKLSASRSLSWPMTMHATRSHPVEIDAVRLRMTMLAGMCPPNVTCLAKTNQMRLNPFHGALVQRSRSPPVSGPSLG